ncbi:MAG TPA: DUF29 domain-containing protein [Azospirillum sp.]|nr:DUF29 domain-containing protein [Azospirillum sp.]
MSNALVPFAGPLYERDHAAWLLEQAGLLRAGPAAAVDASRLAGELEAMVHAERRALGLLLKTAIEHLLKWRFQPERRSEGWRRAVFQARDGIEDILDTSPMLRSDLEALVERNYRRAVRDAALETGLAETAFPATWPFAVEDILFGAF